MSAGARAQTITPLGVSQIGNDSVRVPLTRKRPGLRPSRLPAGAAATPAYTLTSFGAPSANSEPAAFNNTGQVVGYGDTGCYVYDSGSFSRLPIPSAGTQYDNCRIASIDDKTAGGTYQVGGTTANLYTGAAFIVTPRTPIIYYAYEDSSVLGINNNGIALFSALFAPVRTTDFSGLQFFTATNGGGYLTQVQAPASAAAPIHYLLPFQNFGQSTQCAFGGCFINDRSEILGYDSLSITPTSANLAAYTLGNPASLVDLPIDLNASGAFVYGNLPVAFNDRDQILYDANMSQAYLQGKPTIYDMGSGKTTAIPLVTPKCPKGGHGDPLSMNNNGEVLGFYYCNNSFFGYFTWDAVTGTHDLSLVIPDTNFALYPIGINDSGAILIELTAGLNPVSWGRLDPIASSSTKLRTGAQRAH